MQRRVDERGYVAALKPNYRLVISTLAATGKAINPRSSIYTVEKVASDIVAVLGDLGMKTAAYGGIH
jgi:hypothetical protein